MRFEHAAAWAMGIALPALEVSIRNAVPRAPHAEAPQ